MKKVFLILSLLTLVLLCAFATTASDVFDVLAYKEEAPEASASGTILSVSVKSFDYSFVNATDSVIDISDEMVKSRTLSRAFTVTINTNLPNEINVDLEFTPFVNSNDSSKKIGVTYTYSTDPFVKTIGSQLADGGWAYVRVTPDVHLKDNATTISVPASATTVTTKLIQSVAKLELKNKNYNRENYPVEWELPTKEVWWTASTIPGFASTDYYSTTSIFSLSISDADYDSMPTNVDYYAGVRLSFTMV